MKPEMVTIAQAALILGVSPQTLRRWDRLGKLPAKRHPINGYRIYSRNKLVEWAERLEIPNMHRVVKVMGHPRRSKQSA